MARKRFRHTCRWQTTKVYHPWTKKVRKKRVEETCELCGATRERMVPAEDL